MFHKLLFRLDWALPCLSQSIDFTWTSWSIDRDDWFHVEIHFVPLWIIAEISNTCLWNIWEFLGPSFETNVDKWKSVTFAMLVSTFYTQIQLSQQVLHCLNPLSLLYTLSKLVAAIFPPLFQKCSKSRVTMMCNWVKGINSQFMCCLRHVYWVLEPWLLHSKTCFSTFYRHAMSKWKHYFRVWLAVNWNTHQFLWSMSAQS